MNSAHVVWRVLISATPLATGDCWMTSRMSFVMSETSQRSSVDSVNEVLKTFMSVSFSEPASEIRQREGQRGRAEANRYSKGTFTRLSNLDVQAVFGSRRSRRPS